jgi:cytochrome c oxidase cbb3-type subunit 3
MKFRTYLENIAGIEVFPLISLIIFFLFFASLIVFVLRIDKKSLGKMSSLPLNDGVVKKSAMSLLLIAFTSLSAFAQDEEPIRAITGTDLILYVVLGILFFVTILVIIVLANAISLLNQMSAKKGPEGESTAVFSEHWWKKFVGAGISLKDEKHILIDGHDYDGIQELDNRMPPWLQSLFVATILIAIGYSVYYFSGMGDMQLAELDKEIAQAEIEKKAYMEKVGASMDENSVTAITDAAILAEGQTLFQEKCTACHGADGGGSVGPNLTDAYWLHGGSIRDIFKVVKYGVPEKGMISWEKQLSPTDIQKVSSYVLSLKGTKPAAPKETQGELFEGDQLSAK